MVQFPCVEVNSNRDGMTVGEREHCMAAILDMIDVETSK